MGGGSGGHVTPVVAVLNELAKQTTEPLDVEFICDKSFAGQATTIVAAASMPVRMTVIAAGKLRRYKHFRFVDYITTPSVTLNNIVDVAKLFVGFLQSLWILWRRRPEVIFAKGGFVCLPVGWAARLLKIPIVIHDSDARPGLTNRLLAPFAAAIATGYPLDYYPYPLKKSRYTGVPIRDAYTHISATHQLQLKKRLEIKQGALFVVAFGGGLGARTINEAIIKAAPSFEGLAVTAILVSGVAQYAEVSEAAKPYRGVLQVKDFVANGMASLLGAADVVITRASATSLQELAGLGKAVIAVPARQLGDQHKNAELYAMSDAAIVVSDDQLEDGELVEALKTLAVSPELRTRLADNIHQFAKPHAAKDVAELILDVVAKKRNQEAV